ncbi:DoxX family protein [Nocardia terpenica]|uniref:DoxX family membrane protein n=1 Tax=Nocardia terpenica TaxID=455432 RepID=A0A6G9Z9K0_9NOCA|nr:DoxX family protein [Nocardia terpenica]QIS22289.1 DoxX family membrane protein [Nocardia terpenica]
MPATTFDIAGVRRAALLLTRVVLGVSFGLSGTSAVFGHPNATKADVFSWPYWWGGAIEIVVAVAILAGAFTLFAGLIGAGHMAYAYLFVHVADHPSQWWNAYANGGLAASAFSAGFLLIALFGPGLFALDSRLRIPLLERFRY